MRTSWLLPLLLLLSGPPACTRQPARLEGPHGASQAPPRAEGSPAKAQASPGEDDYAQTRRAMVERTIQARGVQDPRVLAAMEKVPRHLFVPPTYRDTAYADSALPIAHGQTISQPLVVAMMTELARIRPGDRVLEVGTGSGYQAAVLAECGAEVYTVEIVPELAEQAGALLERLGYRQVHVRAGDGYRGWPEHAPFQAIVVTAAPPKVPPPLLEQLAPGGRLVLPEGVNVQDLTMYERTDKGFEVTRHGEVLFVPMTGEAQEETSGP